MTSTWAIFVASVPPVATAQALSAAKNTALAFELVATDGNLDPLAYVVLTQPLHGTLTGTAPNMTYQPTTDYVGNDQITFQASDGQSNSSIATVTINVYESALVVDASSSPLVKASAFDAARWSSDATFRAAYLAQSVPGRVWQTAEPGSGVPVLVPMGPRNILGGLLPTTLTVRSAPSAPVTFTVFGDGGLGPLLLSSISVQADSGGIAQVGFSLLLGGTGQVRASSPLASNFVQFTITTPVAP